MRGPIQFGAPCTYMLLVSDVKDACAVFLYWNDEVKWIIRPLTESIDYWLIIDQRLIDSSAVEAHWYHSLNRNQSATSHTAYTKLYAVEKVRKTKFDCWSQCHLTVFRLNQMHEMQAIATNVPVSLSLCHAASQGFDVKKWLNGLMLCLGWRLLETQGTLCWMGVPVPPLSEGDRKCIRCSGIVSVHPWWSNMSNYILI